MKDAPVTKVTGKMRVWQSHSADTLAELYEQAKSRAPNEYLSKFNFLNLDMSEQPGWLEVGTAEITLTLFPFEELIDGKLRSLKMELNDHQAESYMKTKKLEDAIQNLLALPAPKGEEG